MLTVTSKLRYDQCRQELNTLTLEQVFNARELEKVTSRLSAMEDEYGTEECESVQAYQDLVSYESELEVKKESIATQIEELNSNMKTYQTLQKNSIKDATSFWCFGG